MILKQTSQIDIENINSIGFDLYLAASGFESRATFVTKRLSPRSRNKICFGFTEHRENVIRKQNDIFFENEGFEIKVCSGNESAEIEKLLNKYILSFKRNVINILVDYSCMTRVWYAEILDFFRNINLESKQVNIYFSYSQAAYVKAPESLIYNKYVSPIHKYYSLSAPIKPTALIVGLGYIESRAYGLAEYFDVEPYLFISDSSSSSLFFQELIDNNTELINSVHNENIFYYPLENLAYSEALLYNLVKDLNRDFRVVLAPCGPKPFTLLSLITSIRNEGVDVWRISAGEDDLPLDKTPEGKILIYKVTFI